ncbi:MAG: sigma-70 family RNA polymerase sigma factor [Verrucomicrobia bacterium]|nr:sigma-70 family RNA polymerase sigma factor [Verrucomicrobiota bacterium]
MSDDAEFVRAVQRGDQQAFEPLLERHLPQLRAFIALRAPVPHLIDEISHESFVFAYRNIHGFQAETSFSAWLRAIASNLLRAELQRHAREQAGRSRYEEWKLVQSQARASERLDAPDAEYLAQCLDRMGAGARELLEERYREGRDSATMAGMRKKSLEWVRITLFRLRQQLKLCVEQKLKEAASGH